MMKFFRAFFLGCGLLAVLAIIVAVVLVNQVWHFYARSVNPAEHSVDFVVNEGETWESVTKRLEDEAIIANAFWFRVYARLSGHDDALQGGAHTLVMGNAYADTLDRLTTPAMLNEVQVTIPEGLTIKQMGELLVQKGLANEAEWSAATGVDSPFESHSFVVNAQKPDDVDLEGYLFPDTYRFMVDASAEDIVEIMIDNMERRVASLGATPTGDAEGMTMHEILTLASIVEREVRQPETMKNVADIFLKRLDIGMALQADSTVNYVTGGDSPSITLEERDNTESPYNTYKYVGLPPGPISNPGLNAIDAVLNPTHNEYLYFLTTDSGDIYYASTYDQHVDNKNRYLK